MLWKKFHHASQLTNLLDFSVIYQEFQLAYVVNLTLYNYYSWKAFLNRPNINKPINFKCQKLWEDNYIIHNSVVAGNDTWSSYSKLWIIFPPYGAQLIRMTAGTSAYMYTPIRLTQHSLFWCHVTRNNSDVFLKNSGRAIAKIKLSYLIVHLLQVKHQFS